MNYIPYIVFQKLNFKNSHNQIGIEHFRLKLESQIFHKHVVFTESKATTAHHLNPKKHALMIKFCFKIHVMGLLYLSTLGMLE